jgi:hypothetical protein
MFSFLIFFFFFFGGGKKLMDFLFGFIMFWEIRPCF